MRADKHARSADSRAVSPDIAEAIERLHSHWRFYIPVTLHKAYLQDHALIEDHLATLEAEMNQRFADTIERCARVADEEAERRLEQADAASDEEADYYHGGINAVFKVASAIRALPREATPEGPSAPETT